jgi:hypothetical protein
MRAFYRLDPSFLIADEAGGRAEQHEFDPFFMGVVDFRGPGRHLRLGAAVDDVGMVRAHAQGGAGRVHGHVAGPEGGHILAFDQGRVVFREGVRLHQVGPGEIFVGRVNADQVLAGNVQEHGQPRPHSQEDRVEALLKELVHGIGAADDLIDQNLDSQLFQIVAFISHDLFGQPKFRDAVEKHAAGGVQGLKNGDLVPEDQVSATVNLKGPPPPPFAGGSAGAARPGRCRW